MDDLGARRCRDQQTWRQRLAGCDRPAAQPRPHSFGPIDVAREGVVARRWQGSASRHRGRMQSKESECNTVGREGRFAVVPTRFGHGPGTWSAPGVLVRRLLPQCA